VAPDRNNISEETNDHDLHRWICGGGANREPRRLQEACRNGRTGFQGAWCLENGRMLGRRRSGRKLTSFPTAVQKKEDETVVFSWIVWPSRQARDEGMKKVMADPRIQSNVNPMPFDGKRLIFGGFEVLVEA
jgi:uncharacterized protein YbaA (DUF1428 family)